MRAAIVLVAALLSGCASSNEQLRAVMSPLCLFNCMTVIHYATGVETLVTPPAKVNH